MKYSVQRQFNVFRFSARKMENHKLREISTAGVCYSAKQMRSVFTEFDYYICYYSVGIWITTANVWVIACNPVVMRNHNNQIIYIKYILCLYYCSLYLQLFSVSLSLSLSFSLSVSLSFFLYSVTRPVIHCNMFSTNISVAIMNL